MKGTYKYKFIVSASQVNKNHMFNIEPALELCQEVAILHAIELGWAPTVMANHKKFFAVSKLKLEFLSPLKEDDKVELLTYAIEPKKSFTFEREFAFKANGQNRILGTSKWCLIDTEKNSLAHMDTIADIMPKKLAKSNNFGIEFERVPFDKTFKYHHSRRIMFNDIDINGHCNNQKYAEMAINCIPLEWANKEPKSFEISYVKQCYYGDTIEVYAKEEENKIYVCGTVADTVVFNSVIEFKK